MTDYEPIHALSIARQAHAGQFRRDGKTPYMNHPIDVSDYFEPFTIEWQGALLHDTIEDTYMEQADLFNLGVPFAVVQIVLLLTKKKETSYNDFISHIIKSGNKAAIRVKMADILANLSDKPTFRQMVKYGKALSRLAETLDKHELSKTFK